MAKRTPEEILAQREAWLARKAAREAGQDIPMQPPAKPGEEPPPAAEPAPAEESTEPEAAQEPAEPEASEPEPAQPVVQASAEAGKPKAPATGKRTPEEIRAQREAWMARKAAKEAGVAVEAPAPAAEKPVAAKPAAEKSAAPKPAAKPAPKPAVPRPKAAAPAPSETSGPITRREFLNYAWLASIALVSLELVGVGLWFAFPNFKEGEFGGQFPIGTAANILPEVNSPPVPYTDGKFWLTNVDTEFDGEPRKGVLALYKVCTHLGCLYQWIDMTFRFECPCHGSKFSLTGDYIGGPARRSLDRFVIIARAPDGTEKTTNAAGEPLEIGPEDEIIIDTGNRILGSSDIIPA